jgi:hypothetical protein
MRARGRGLATLENRLRKLEERRDFDDPWPTYNLEVDRLAKKSISREDRRLLSDALIARKQKCAIAEVYQAVLQRWDDALYKAEDTVPRPYGLDRDDMGL